MKTDREWKTVRGNIKTKEDMQVRTILMQVWGWQ